MVLARETVLFIWLKDFGLWWKVEFQPWNFLWSKVGFCQQLLLIWFWNRDWNWNYSNLIINNSLALISFPSVLLCFVSDFTTTGYVKITSWMQNIEAQLFFSNMFQYFSKWFGVGSSKAIMHFFFLFWIFALFLLLFIFVSWFQRLKLEPFFSSLNGSYLECQCGSVCVCVCVRFDDQL